MTNAFDANAWAEWQKSEIEKYGNNHAGWISVSTNLILAGAILSKMYASALVIMLRNVLNGGAATDKPRTDDEEATVHRGHQTHTIGLMLFAFAIECLLKAVFLKRGGKLYREGKLNIPRRPSRTHNLLDIAEALDCSSLFTNQQQEVLDLLSARNEMGRYPVHSKFDTYGLQPPNGNDPVRFYGIWDARKSAIVFDIIRLLYTELGEALPADASALLEESEVVRKSYGMDVP